MGNLKSVLAGVFVEMERAKGENHDKTHPYNVFKL